MNYRTRTSLFPVVIGSFSLVLTVAIVVLLQQSSRVKTPTSIVTHAPFSFAESFPTSGKGVELEIARSADATISPPAELVALQTTREKEYPSRFMSSVSERTLVAAGTSENTASLGEIFEGWSATGPLDGYVSFSLSSFTREQDGTGSQMITADKAGVGISRHFEGLDPTKTYIAEAWVYVEKGKMQLGVGDAMIPNAITNEWVTVSSELIRNTTDTNLSIVTFEESAVLFVDSVSIQEIIHTEEDGELSTINMASSAPYHDFHGSDMNSKGSDPSHPEGGESNDWLYSDPGFGKTTFRVAVFIPRNYLQEVGRPDLTDAQITTALRGRTQQLIQNFNSYLGTTTVVQTLVFIKHDSRTLSEILCHGANPCDEPDWGYLMAQAESSFSFGNVEYPIVYIFGGAGVAHAGIVIGDWAFGPSLFYYLPQGCEGNGSCSTESGIFTTYHEMGHAFGLPWHLPNYLGSSVMGFLDSAGSLELVDHPGYPEKYVVCTSSLNTGVKNCGTRFQSPNRQTITTSIYGHYINPLCNGSYNTSKKVFCQDIASSLKAGDQESFFL